MNLQDLYGEPLHGGRQLCREMHRMLTHAFADTYFCVVDLHAITMPHDPKDLKEASRRCGPLMQSSTQALHSHAEHFHSALFFNSRAKLHYAQVSGDLLGLRH